VEYLRDDPQGTANHLELVDWGLFLRELVKSADGIQPKSLVMKLLLNSQTLEGVLSPLNDPLYL
jgi:hypothetical protein